MSVHRGEIVRKALEDEGRGATWLARKMGVDRTTVYLWWKNKDLDLDTVIEIGRALKYDFSYLIPELSSYVSEPDVQYGPRDLKGCIEERDRWHRKYTDLLEKHNKLLTDMQANSRLIPDHKVGK